MEDPYSQFEPENYAVMWAVLVLWLILGIGLFLEDGTWILLIGALGILMVPVGWIAKKFYEAIFDDPITRGFFSPTTWNYYGLYVVGLWIVISVGALFVAGHLDSFGLWGAFILIALPALFGAFFLFRGVHSQFLAKRWSRAADKMGLDIDVDPDSSMPRMRGEYFGRPVEVTVEEEANSHFTSAQADLGESSRGIEIASSDSLYFRPHEGTVVGDSEPGAPEFRIYGISRDLAEELATSELLQQLEILEWMTEEMRIGPETAYARHRGATLATTKLVHLTSTLAEIADMIDEVNATPAAPA